MGNIVSAATVAMKVIDLVAAAATKARRDVQSFSAGEGVERARADRLTLGPGGTPGLTEVQHLAAQTLCDARLLTRLPVLPWLDGADFVTGDELLALEKQLPVDSTVRRIVDAELQSQQFVKSMINAILQG